METEEVIVRVDTGARTEAVRAKIAEMKQKGFKLVGPEPDLPENTRFDAATKLTFTRNRLTFAKIGGGAPTKAPGEAILHSGPLEVSVPGSELDI